jgi:glycosyltransferase involved in cell wall biosynthesis
MPVKIGLLSNSPWAPSGYGTQALIWSRKWRDLGHEVVIFAFHGLQGAPLWHDGVPVLPALDDPYGQDVLPGHYQWAKADLLVTLMDAWVLKPQYLQGINAAFWMPVDCDPISFMDKTFLGGVPSGQPIAMSRFGERVLTAAGQSPLYVPHGIPADVFKPPEDRRVLRAELGMDDRFVVAINAANSDPIRKGFPEMFRAFAEFRRRHGDALLLVHARTHTQMGVNLRLLADDLGLGDDAVKFGDQYQIAAGMVTQADLARWYGLADVLLHTSYGEGFGLAAVEAQACGVPVITTDFSAMGELCGAGWKIPVDPVDDLFWNRGHSSWWARPKPRRILAALEKAYRGSGQLHGKAREFALGYDADRVLQDYWAPALKQLEDAL